VKFSVFASAIVELAAVPALGVLPLFAPQLVIAEDACNRDARAADFGDNMIIPNARR
jgi:hypothetical protein